MADKGLGDTISRVTKIFGIKECGGCKARKQWLNIHVPYRRKTNMEEVPTQIGNVRIRHWDDGTFGIVRRDLKVEKELDSKYVRIGALKWAMKVEDGLEIDSLRKYVDGKLAYIVGKGPSLDHVSKNDFPNQDALIICINESIHKINELGLPNKLIGMQSDGKLKDTCFVEGCGLLVTERAHNWYPDHKEKYVFNTLHFGLGKGAITVASGIAILKSLGVKEIKLVSFDSCTDGSLSYAQCIGYSSALGGKPERFNNHPSIIADAIRGIPFEHITPKGLGTPSPDIPQQSPDNPVEHREPDPAPRDAGWPAKPETPSSTELSPRETPPDHSGTEPQS